MVCQDRENQDPPSPPTLDAATPTPAPTPRAG